MNTHPRIERILAWAEQNRMCAWPLVPNDYHLLQRRVQTGGLVMPFPRFYVRTAIWGNLSFSERISYILRTACAKDPTVTVCGISAAAALGYTSTYYQQRYIHVVARKTSESGRHGQYVAHYLPDVESVMVNGIRTTHPLQTMFDCARTLDFSTAMAICTMGLRMTGSTAQTLQAYCADMTRKRGLPRARYVAQHVDTMCTNGGEAIAYAVALELGFSKPECQRQFINQIDGSTIYVDFTWTLDDGSLIIGELDGREKYENPAMTGGADSVAVTLREKDRESAITMQGIPVVRFQMSHVRNRRQLEQRLLAAGVPQPDKGKRTPFTGFICNEY
ncbi:hypothetical protein JS530_01800 [Bifidobacterium sp. LC6]|uniref:CTP synthase n=1 Tax=Bifidobacterium colobi TaxID=2809026 RepID=A0ABS5UT93_9BIFI|nr:hypothetical protein [Bifidobacterium colobi]MBT1174258.1 hypothetical protein [Bifidobacterium colobi]